MGTNGPRVLYHTKSCLCLNASQCQPLGAELYTDTRTGLDRMMLRHRELGKVIQDFQFMVRRVAGCAQAGRRSAHGGRALGL